ncbi:hypothetical protein [Methanolapillus ohkumae]|uniref:Nickel transport protein n=1 Tax=Methanolapillus ohkumae TaxID=3028298 RepID=A0AA96ZXL8_9EURY|nr:hypothetical protein MsAm2_09930 [Methanosarcinaceae archaeon Am2]
MKIQKTVSLFILICLMIALLSVPAAAHGTYMSYETGNIKVKAWYQGGEPMANCDYEVYSIIASNGNENETLYLTGKTDESGTLTFEPKDSVSIYRVKVVSGEHAAQRRIDLADGAANAAGDHGISWLNVFAGLGYIVGIAGILMYALSRKNMNNTKK